MPIRMQRHDNGMDGVLRAGAACRAGFHQGGWLLVVLLLAGCGHVELYTNLPEREVNEMMAVLMDRGIGCTKTPGEEGTWTLAVASEHFAESVELLKELGYPRDTYVDMGEVFQKSGLVSSPSEERIRFMHALSQELANTMSQIDGVLTARVHIVLPENNPFGENVRPSSAAVFIKYRHGDDMTELIPTIKQLVLGSIEGLEADKITVTTFEADPPRPPAATDGPDELTDVLGVRVARGSAQRLWMLLGAGAGVAVLALVLAAWLGLRQPA